MLRTVNKPQNSNKKKGEVQELFLSLGCLAIENSAQIIIKYNDELTSNLKRTLTLIINNLQICSQLKNRISNLEERIEQAEEDLTAAASVSEKENIKECRRRLEESLGQKEKKLTQLNEESITSLLEVGKQFNKNRLLKDKQKFREIYNKIDLLLANSDLQVEIENVVAKDLDVAKLSLNSLFSIN
jgi:septal ring factor EnvC (AmiA/AmiB activator)